MDDGAPALLGGLGFRPAAQVGRSGHEMCGDQDDRDDHEERPQRQAGAGGQRGQPGADDPGETEGGEEGRHDAAGVGGLDPCRVRVHRRVDGAQGEPDQHERDDEQGHRRARRAQPDRDERQGRERPDDAQRCGRPPPGDRRSGQDAADAGDDRDQAEEQGQCALPQIEAVLDGRDTGHERGEADTLADVRDGAGDAGAGRGRGHGVTIALRRALDGRSP